MEEQTVATADGKKGIQKSWLGILGTSLLRESLWLVHGVCQLLQGRQWGPLADSVAPTPSSLLPRGWASQDPGMGVLMAAQAGSVLCSLAFLLPSPRSQEMNCAPTACSGSTEPLSTNTCLSPCPVCGHALPSPPERGAGPPRPCHTLQARERAPSNSQHRTEASHPARKLHPTDQSPAAHPALPQLLSNPFCVQGMEDFPSRGNFPQAPRREKQG